MENLCRQSYDGISTKKEDEMASKNKDTAKSAAKNTLASNAKSALPNTANNKFGNGTQGFSYDRSDLGTNLPNSFVDNSGDSNQMSRSEEEEMENNTDLKARRKFSFLS
jgi:hypothetical protein